MGIYFKLDHQHCFLAHVTVNLTHARTAENMSEQERIAVKANVRDIIERDIKKKYPQALQSLGENWEIVRASLTICVDRPHEMSASNSACTASKCQLLG